ncbi:hypothetical protein GCM10023347_36130 [Streptomyces chumphonensis]|uniref:Secreted protein n=1 Tax=Streptomyces chumphonensis TaxID=1214925 RepID=A0A927EVN9_9ACTN|nr:hypothetical protein [Streptomyces chumphonensis]MBD3930849.1 hypothetical protein [Streptomyces chumphonensis]
MRQGWLQGGAWLLATGAAVTLSWFGVHTVMTGTAYDPPVTTPVARADAAESASGTPPVASSATHRPPGSPAPPEPASPAAPDDGDGAPGSGEGADGAGEESPGSATSQTTPTGEPTAGETPEDAPAQAPGEDRGEVRSYTADGGRVAFDLRADSASLVSATPHSGWEVRVWTQEQWVRVTFSRGDRSSSVFCTWHDGPPRVQVDER